MLLTKVIDLRNLLVLSIKLEKASRDFYHTAMGKATSLQAREILRILFNARDEHIKKLYDCAVGLPGESTLATFAQFERELIVEHFEDTIEVNPFVVKEYSEFADELELLEMAIEREYVSYDFFLQALKVVSNSEVKAVLYECAMEEQHNTAILLER
jgi:rubrerythrin